MSLPVSFLRAARREYDDAADWYEQRQTGLGARFTASVQKALDQISAQPYSYAVAVDAIREAPVSRFPYRVYYRLESAQVVVIAVFHTARDPSIWQGRA